MKMHQIYECETCGFTSKIQDEVDLCEAKHIGLKTLEEKHAYEALKSFARHCTWKITNDANNDQTRAAEDKAYKDLLQFETDHNMTIKR